MREPLVAGNWKMHGTLAGARALASEVRAGVLDFTGVEVAVCPPFVHLAAVAEVLGEEPVALGAQNVSQYPGGAHTGEIAASMLKDVGCRYVIVGHSERRTVYAETDTTVAEKFALARAEGLTPILCLGETLAERERGETEAVVARQLGAVLEREGAGVFAGAVMAYEPVWAIGTGRTASPEQANAVHAFIRERLEERGGEVAKQARIVYGGSVKPANAHALFAMPDIDGGLIGGASLEAQAFLRICEAARR